jgi:lyso-ornithine lipid O-acyltransferase
MAGVALVGLVAYLLRAENRAGARGRARWLSRTCARALRVMHVRTVVTGSAPAGLMLTPNHVSYLDIFVLAALSPTTFVSKAEVARWPVFGWFAATAGTLFIRREKKSDLQRVGEQLGPVLSAGVNLAVFLEGTSTDGQNVLRFRPGLLEPIVQLRAAAVPVAISYHVRAPHDRTTEVAWWGDMPLVPHVMNLLSLPAIEARVAFGAPCGPSEDRKSLVEALQENVERQLRTISDS